MQIGIFRSKNRFIRYGDLRIWASGLHKIYDQRLAVILLDDIRSFTNNSIGLVVPKADHSMVEANDTKISVVFLIFLGY